MVDYGRCGFIGFENIRSNIILEETPVQIIRCSSLNFNPFGGKKIDSDELSSIKEVILSKDYMVNVMSVVPPMKVLFLSNSKDLVNLINGWKRSRSDNYSCEYLRRPRP